ncbi:hypothetical protein D9757_006759 [Collybiopsis confluens]|uniref:Cyclin n=1 Tax=Collybiopsis confluens TaxID=2823264 RepID=A0A8H5M9M4_9AGAR|nr:hypothetical protein D9757_006759 [Collybiopsis confluens]
MTVPQILTSWSLQWPSSKQPSKMASTMTTTAMTTTTLPPIAFFDRHLPDHSPDDVSPPHYSPPAPPVSIFTDTNMNVAVDWLDFTHKRSAHFIAEKTCEMICYLWFTTPQSTEGDDKSLFSRPSSVTTLQLVASPTFVLFMQKLLETTQVSQSVIVLSLHYIYRLKERNRSTPAQPGSEFRIAVAGLMMANKFLDDNTYTNKTWSEVSGIDLIEINRMEREFLMGVDCNLYVDKPTYESWLNLLKGLVLAKERDSRQYRHKSRSVARTSRHPSSFITPNPLRFVGRGKPLQHRARSTSPEQSSRTLAYATPVRRRPPPLVSTPSSHPGPAAADLRSGSKRTAQAAFSPTSATFSHIPSKRPVSISLQIPPVLTESGSSSGPNSSSPLEGLQSFATMSIDSPNTQAHPSSATRSSRAVSAATTPAPSTPSSWSSAMVSKQTVVPVTLSTAYALDERRRSAVPQTLYFYTLACSPTDHEETDSQTQHQTQQHRSRKARLRYHQPPPSSSYSYSSSSTESESAPYTFYDYPSSSRPPPPTYAYRYPMNVQSASTSPVHVTAVPPHHHHHHHDNLNHLPTAPPPPPPTSPLLERLERRARTGRQTATAVAAAGVPSLPHFYETDWTGAKKQFNISSSLLFPPPPSLYPSSLPPQPQPQPQQTPHYTQPSPLPTPPPSRSHSHSQLQSHMLAEPPRYQALVPQAQMYVPHQSRTSYSDYESAEGDAMDQDPDSDRDDVDYDICVEHEAEDDEDVEDDDDVSVEDDEDDDDDDDDEEADEDQVQNCSPPIPSATFANAGPPGFQVPFCPTPERGSPLYPHRRYVLGQQQQSQQHQHHHPYLAATAAHHPYSRVSGGGGGGVGTTNTHTVPSMSVYGSRKLDAEFSGYPEYPLPPLPPSSGGGFYGAYVYGGYGYGLEKGSRKSVCQ